MSAYFRCINSNILYIYNKETLYQTTGANNQDQLMRNRTESERKQVTEDTVRNVINKLNNGKSALLFVQRLALGNENLSPDLFKRNSEIIVLVITELKLRVLSGDIIIDILMFAYEIILVASTSKDVQLMLD